MCLFAFKAITYIVIPSPNIIKVWTLPIITIYKSWVINAMFNIICATPTSTTCSVGNQTIFIITTCSKLSAPIVQFVTTGRRKYFSKNSIEKYVLLIKSLTRNKYGLCWSKGFVFTNQKWKLDFTMQSFGTSLLSPTGQWLTESLKQRNYQYIIIFQFDKLYLLTWRVGPTFYICACSFCVREKIQKNICNHEWPKAHDYSQINVYSFHLNILIVFQIYGLKWKIDTLDFKFQMMGMKE